jgi:arginine repressor
LCVSRVIRNFGVAKVANSRLKDVVSAASNEIASESRRRRLMVSRDFLAFDMSATIQNHAVLRVMFPSDLR